MNTAGIDLSLTSTGVCVNGEPFSIRSKKRGVDRLIEIRDLITESVKKNNVSYVALEGYSYASRFSQAHSIGELGGVGKVSLAEAGVEIAIIPPTNRAKFATGRGNASKDEVVMAVLNMTTIPQQPGLDDLCDAWVLEKMLQYALGDRTMDLSDKQISAISGIQFNNLLKGN